MKVKQINSDPKPTGTPVSRYKASDLSPPENAPVKELEYATMSGIIPGRLHLCRA